MSADDDKVWDSVAEQLRRLKGYAPPNEEEAQAELAEVANEPMMSQRQAADVVRRILSGKTRDTKPTIWHDEPTGQARAIQAQSEYGSVCRNEGEGEADTKEIEARLYQEMLDEHANDTKAND
jgi:hypothetical protein